MCWLFLLRCVFMLFEEMDFFLSLSLIWNDLNLFQPKKFHRGRLLGIYIGCIIAKTNIHVFVVGYYVPTYFRHFSKMLDTMFQHAGTIQCAQVYAYLYARFILFGIPHPHILLSKLRAHLFRISCANIPKGVTIFQGIFGVVWKFLKMCLHIRTFLFCY